MKFARHISAKMYSERNKKEINKAINKGDWPSVLFLRRKAVAASPNSSSAWLQFGHALKECGFYKLAGEAYERAKTLSPSSKEIVLQKGHLLKLSGNIEEAYEQYREASDGWVGNSRHVQVEVSHLEHIARALKSRGVFPSRNEMDSAIYLSCVAKMFEENDRTDMGRRIGRADYSYAFAMKGFAAALDDLGIDYHILNEVAGIADIRKISSAKKIIHIGFYPPEKLNLLKGAYNIVCFAWEFERLRFESENNSFNAFSDQATMLNLADEVWVPSRHGVESVRPSLSNIVTYMPSPAIVDANVRNRKKPRNKRAIIKAATSLRGISWLPLNILPRLQGALGYELARKSASIQKVLFGNLDEGREPTIYVSIFNAHDYRKNADNLIRGFAAFARENPDAYLFLKVADDQKPDDGPNGSVLRGQMSSPSSLVASVSSPNIWLTSDAFTREQLNAFFDVAQFYVCSAIAEGQNLPLIEAMARKAVPVSVAHTAMADYIYEDNAIVINHGKCIAPIDFSRRYQMFGVTLDVASAEDVFEALCRSKSLSTDDYERMGKRAFDVVQDVFGNAGIAERLNELLA